MLERLAKIEKFIFTDEWEMYFENPIQDYYNITKEKIRLIISSKRLGFLRHVPDNYTPKWVIWYWLIRWYNCQWRCHYCYLQSYFKSPDMVKFFNIEDYLNFLEKFLEEFFKKYPNKKIILYDWDFQDSLGLVYLKKNIYFLEKILQVIKKCNDKVKLEIRTKQIVKEIPEDWNQMISEDCENKGFERLYGKIFKKNYINNLIVAITFSPQAIITKYEWWTSDLKTRIDFARYVQKKWFKVWIRIDPVILDDKNDIYKSVNLYLNLIDKLKANLNLDLVEDRSIWLLRLKKNLYKKYKNTDLVNNLTDYEKWFYRYPESIRKKVYKTLLEKIDWKSYICMDDLLI